MRYWSLAGASGLVLMLLASCYEPLKPLDCRSDSECKAAQICVDFQCRDAGSPCQGNQDCKRSELCVQGRCTASASLCIDGEKRSCYTGPASTKGVGSCKAGEQICALGQWGACVGQSLPQQQELCGNNVDDDCNGQADEGCDCDPKGPPRVCGQDLGLCRSGTQRCGPDGKWSTCEGWIQPSGERCNGKDDDCDGKVDEDFKSGAGLRGIGISCREGVGACQRNGVFVCSPDGLSTICNAKAGSPNQEICNGKDDDCDGNIDEDTSGGSCIIKGAFGLCATGTRSCSQGSSICRSTHTPSTEVCDGKDNDCDGQIDEGCTAPKASQCSPCFSDGECGAGYKCLALVSPDKSKYCLRTCKGHQDCSPPFLCRQSLPGLFLCTPPIDSSQGGQLMWGCQNYNLFDKTCKGYCGWSQGGQYGGYCIMRSGKCTVRCLSGQICPKLRKCTAVSSGGMACL